MLAIISCEQVSLALWLKCARKSLKYTEKLLLELFMGAVYGMAIENLIDYPKVKL